MENRPLTIEVIMALLPQQPAPNSLGTSPGTVEREKSKSITIRQRTRREESKETCSRSHSASMKEICDFLTWQMYDRIVSSRLLTSRRRTTPQPIPTAKDERKSRLDEPELCDSDKTNQPTCENDMIFALDL